MKRAFFVPKKWVTIIGLVSLGLIILVLGIYTATSIFSWHIKALLIIGFAGLLTFWVLSAVISRFARYGSNVAIAVLVALSIVVLVSIASAKFFMRFDTTSGKLFSLSDQTTQVLKKLQQDLTITAFYSENHPRQQFVRFLLDEYARQSKKIHVNLVDLVSQPGLGAMYKVKKDGTTVFEMGNKREDIISHDNEEQDFTSAIIKLMSNKKKKVYFLNGHDERSIDSDEDDGYSVLKGIIKNSDYMIDKLTLHDGSDVPDDCDALVIAAPREPLSPVEEHTINNYLENGGKTVILLEPPPTPSLSGILTKWGVKAHDDIVFDFSQSLFGDGSIPVTIRYDKSHPITTSLVSLATFFPVVRSLEPIKDPAKEIETTRLVMTSGESYGEMDIDMLMSELRFRYDEGQDLKGPLTVAIAVTLKEAKKERRVLVVVGDSDFLANRYLKEYRHLRMANSELFMNSLDWLTVEEDLISIKPKDQSIALVGSLNGGNLRFVAYLSIFAVPVLLLIFGSRTLGKWMTITGSVGLMLTILAFEVRLNPSIFKWYLKLPIGIGIFGILAFWITNIITNRITRYGSNIFVMVLIVFSIMVLVNFVSARHSAKIDTTERYKKVSISEQTRNIIKNIKQDVNIIAFYTKDHYRQKFVRSMLAEYARHSERINVIHVDPAEKPGIANAYGINENGTTVFETGSRREYVQSYENEEQDFTRAILKLFADKQKKVYFLDGHGEHDIDRYDEDGYSSLRMIIEAENYEVDRLLLAGQESFPDDCDVLVIGGAQRPLWSQEEKAINDYLDKGGKAIIMVDPPPSPSLEGITWKWGIEVHDDIILDDSEQTTLVRNSNVPVPKFMDHIITDPISKAELKTFFPMARSITINPGTAKNLEVKPLLVTSDHSWGEKDIQAFPSNQKYDEETDHKGPLYLATAVAIKENIEKRTLVVIGDSDFVANQYMQLANPDFFMNSLNWLTEEEELIAIRPKEQSGIYGLTGKELRFVVYSSILAVPIILLIIGGRVWWRRR